MGHREGGITLKCSQSFPCGSALLGAGYQNRTVGQVGGQRRRRRGGERREGGVSSGAGKAAGQRARLIAHISLQAQEAGQGLSSDMALSPFVLVSSPGFQCASLDTCGMDTEAAESVCAIRIALG